jgi:hypothetical protein
MAVQSSPHWTDNEEVLERYVLGRLDPLAKRVLEEHLEACASCREAVTRERELVAGIRRLGREELKARLARRVANAVRPSIPWPHVISIAAVLVISVGVALYRFWTPIETWYEESFTQTSPRVAETPAATPEENAVHPGASDLEEIARRNQPLVEEIQRAKGQDQKIVAAPAAADEMKEMTNKPGREDKSLTMAGASSQAVWVEGVVIPFAKDEARKRAGAHADRDERAGEKAQPQPAEAPGALQQEGALALQAVSTELRQEPLRSLPHDRQQMQAAETQGVIETLLEKTAEGLRLTFYVDPPIAEEELRAAQVQAIAADSILVVMPTQQIAYKIPAALGNVQAVQLKAK